MASTSATRLHHEFTGIGVAAAAPADVVAGDTLLAVFGSLVLLPAVTVAVTLPLRGAV